MINFEKYHDEILKIVDVPETNSNEVLRKLHSKFNIETQYARSLVGTFTIWGYSEYIEPYKLTKQEKWILENLNERFRFISKNGQTNEIAIKEFRGGGISYYDINDIFSGLKFDCLEWDKEYKITDILANCEVINDD